MSMTREEALRTVAGYVGPQLAAQQRAAAPPDIVRWASTNYYIPETGMPIQLGPHQQTYARMFQNPAPLGCDITTYLYSTVKKSGKTAFAGVCSRFAAQYSGNNAEVYFMAHDKEQAKDRAYESAKISIERTPGFDITRRTLPHQWRIIERHAVHLPTSSVMRALAGEYEGAAGGNPTGTFWTELWAFTGERFKRLWDELTPVPTRARSFRFVETYAGFVDESELLYNLYRRAVRHARRLTKRDLEPFAAGADPWPWDDPPPFYLNEAAGIIAYWDEGDAARTRMPWQTSPRGLAYYREQRETSRPETWDRFHNNYWVSSAQAFIQPAWWAACKKPLSDPLPHGWPVVVAVDGSVNSDCTAAVGIAREPTRVGEKWVPSETDVRIVFARVWTPPQGGVIDLDSVEAYLRHICGHHATIAPKWPDRPYADELAQEPTYNVVQLAYDQFQLHQMMTTLEQDFVAWTRSFPQAGEREIADKQLYDLIVRRGIHHNDEYDPAYMANAAAYVAGENAKNQDRLRIVKKAPDLKVDPIVCTSMGARECLRLLLS